MPGAWRVLRGTWGVKGCVGNSAVGLEVAASQEASGGAALAWTLTSWGPHSPPSPASVSPCVRDDLRAPPTAGLAWVWGAEGSWQSAAEGR